MKNKNNENGSVPGTGQESQGNKLVVFAAVGLKLLRKILATLDSINDSLNILAAQKARELNPDKPVDTKVE